MEFGIGGNVVFVAIVDKIQMCRSHGGLQLNSATSNSKTLLLRMVIWDKTGKVEPKRRPHVKI